MRRLRLAQAATVARRFALIVVLGLSLAPACGARSEPKPDQAPGVFLAGLNLPRGIIFDGAGNLIVAEAGRQDTPGGDAGESAALTNHSGRVIQVTPQLTVSTLAEGLPYAFLPALGTGVGASDIVRMDGVLYVLTGEGPDPLSRAVLRIGADGAPVMIASILNFAAKGLTSDLINSSVVRANPYAMVAGPDRKALYVADGATGQVLRVGLDGAISIFAELPNSQPLAGLAFGPDAKLYVTAFSPLPHAPGGGAVWSVDGAGVSAIAVDGLTMPVDVGFDSAGEMVVLEFGDGRDLRNPYAENTGRVVRIPRSGARAVLLDHLNYPTSMAFSGAGDLYIATGGAFTGPRRGTVLSMPCASLRSALACPPPAP